jgi:hypothetical protein
MMPLPLKFDMKGVTYSLLLRGMNVYLYEQSDSNGKIIGYELFRGIVNPAQIINGKPAETLKGINDTEFICTWALSSGLISSRKHALLKALKEFINEVSRDHV